MSRLFMSQTSREKCIVTVFKAPKHTHIKSIRLFSILGLGLGLGLDDYMKM